MENFPAHDPILTVCEQLKDTKNVKKASLNDVLERIKNPEQRIIDLQTKFRETKDDKYKLALPGFVTSGIFSERQASGLTSASGLMMLDFDKLPDTETLQRERKKLTECSFVVVAFISPSGKGLKAIIKIRDWKDQNDYRSIFMEAGAYFGSEYFDSSTSDIARLAFFAHDQDIYINWNAGIFDPEHHLDRDMDTFINEMNNRIRNKKKSFIKGERNNYVFDLACDYRREGLDKQQALNLILNEITLSSDFNLTEVKRTLDSAYKSDKFSTAREDFELWDMYNEDELFKSLQKSKKNPFPIEVFPEKVQDLIINLQDTLNFPVDYTAISMMSAVSVAMGLSCKAKFKKGWIEIGSFYFAIVGKPGTNKSHPMKFALKPLKNRDEEAYRKYIDEKDKYEFFEKLSKKEKAEKQSELVQKPFWKQFIVADFTLEALSDVLSKNKNGIGVGVDELTSWFKNFNRYNSGGEEQFWLTALNGDSIPINRKNAGNHLIAAPFISVVGTIQDDVLNELANGRTGNGFLDRILFAYPDDQDKKPWSEDEMDEELFNQWESVINTVLGLSLNEQSILEFDPEAKSYIINWQNELTKYLNKPENYNLKGISAKLEMYVLRFSLLMEVLYYACGESDLMEISLRSAKASTKLKEYFLQTALKVHSVISKSGHDPIENLSLIEQRVFHALPKEFRLSEGYIVADENRMGRRSFQRFIKEDQGNGKKNMFFENIRHGVYRKKIL